MTRQSGNAANDRDLMLSQRLLEGLLGETYAAVALQELFIVHGRRPFNPNLEDLGSMIWSSRGATALRPRYRRVACQKTSQVATGRALQDRHRRPAHRRRISRALPWRRLGQRRVLARRRAVNRVDTRHEFSLPRELGIFKIVPFVVGRFTGYDDDFESFSSDADSLRFFGTGHVTAARSSSTCPTASNRGSSIFPPHAPHHRAASRWGGFSNVDETDLPEYDAEVESLAATTAAHLGVRKTLANRSAADQAAGAPSTSSSSMHR